MIFLSSNILEMNSLIFVVQTVTLAFVIGISIMAVTWIHKLEDLRCICSDDFRRDYIKYFLYIYIALVSVFYIVTALIFFGLLQEFKDNMVMSILKNVFYLSLILNSIFVVSWIFELKEKDCKCSEDVTREIYYVLNWIYIAFVALVIISIIFFYMLGINIKK